MSDIINNNSGDIAFVELTEKEHGMPELVVKYRFQQDTSTLTIYVNHQVNAVFTDNYAQIIWNKINGMNKKNKGLLTVDMIINIAIAAGDLKDGEIYIKTRETRIVIPRQLAMNKIREMFPKMTLEAIGKRLGGFEHATVIHASKSMAKDVKYFKPEEQVVINEFNEKIDSILNDNQNIKL